MRKTCFRSGRNWLALLLVLFCLVSVGAQQKRRPSRRKSNPIKAVPAPTPDPSAASSALDPSIVSTSDELAPGNSPNEITTKPTASGPIANPGPESVQQTVERLSKQVTNLNEKLSAMEDDQRSLGYVERLSRAEQRSEDLRSQLRDVQSKQLDYEARMDQVEMDLRPENVDASISGFGTTRPEDLRTQRRLLLESEKKRIRAQMDLLDKSRIRLETAIETSDLEMQKLRERMEGTQESAKPRVEKQTGSDTSEPPLP